MSIREIKTEQEYRDLIKESFDRPIFLLKHSTICPISADAKQRFDQFIENNDQVLAYLVWVIESRPLSRWIARDCQVTHQSPQAILFRNGLAIWNRSHGKVNQTELENSLANI